MYLLLMGSLTVAPAIKSLTLTSYYHLNVYNKKPFFQKTSQNSKFIVIISKCTIPV